MYKKFTSFKTEGISKHASLTIKYISTFKETLKLLLNIRTIQSFDKIQLLQKQQLVNYFLKYLNNTSTQGNK